MTNKETLEYEVKLIDKNDKYYEVTFGYEYLQGNKESYFACTSQNGQDVFVPKNEAQEALFNLWKQCHLKSYSTISDIITPEYLENVHEELMGEWETRETVDNIPVDTLYQTIREECPHIEGRYEYHAIAIAIHCECTLDEMKDISNNNNHFTCQGRDYIVATDSEADDLEREAVERVIEDCYLWEFRKTNKDHPALRYINLEEWIDDWCGNRGHNLNSYDGGEEQIYIVNEYYFIYRQ